MTTSVAVAFVAFNAAFVVAGWGVLRVVGVQVNRHADFVLVAYACGVAGSGVAVALLALLDGVPGRRGFVVLAASFFIAGTLVRRIARPVSLSLPPWSRFDVAAAVAVAACAVIVATRFAKWPLGAWDGWAIWSLKTHALYASGGVSSAPFHAAPYPHPDYPLLMPGLQATWLHFVGRYSGELLHLQLVCFLLAFAAALLVLLRSLMPSPLRGFVVVAAVTAPEALGQLVTNYADAPLAFFVAVGVLCLGAWLTRHDEAFLRLAVPFLAAAALTKDEGTPFVAAALCAAAASPAARGRRGALARAALATAVPAAVWRVHATAAGLTDSAYDPSLLRHPLALAHRFHRVPLALVGLVSHSGRWDYLLVVPLIAAAAAAARRRYVQLVFALAWVVLSIAALTTVYWISRLPIREHLDSSASRIVASLVVGLMVLTGVFAAEPDR